MIRPARPLPDEIDRKQALDPQRSFSVQAPAGSGKTELLIQRYLSLLGVVDEPEQILAITFTRKAATEMRTRILEALAEATTDEPNLEQPHHRIRNRLARRALDRDHERDWALLAQPSRMQIGTIDAVNSRLARSAPLSAGFTSGHELVERTETLYRGAARETIAFVAEGGEFGEKVEVLLDSFDNRADRLEKLIAEMLGSRDQWLRVTGAGTGADPAAVRVQLESSLGGVIESFLVRADQALPAQYRSPIAEILQHAGKMKGLDDPKAPVCQWESVTGFPDAAVRHVSLWRSMAAALLTAQGEWRRTLTKAQGFPTTDRAMRDHAMELISALAAGETDELRALLHEVQTLPDPAYTDAQWCVLAALLTVLPLAVANLKRMFAIDRQTDYTEIAQEALAALGNEDEPSELCLALDYGLRHILVDEFQDTSRSQVLLLKRLTAGWQRDSGRTLFLVGDPMQSIYRFRQAEVGLFEHTRARGIGDISLEPLTLATNFRSDPAVVGWFNSVFKAIKEANGARCGAAGFVESAAFNDPDKSAAVRWYPVAHGDAESEARKIVEIVKATPEGSIGILARSRRHAAPVARALRAAEIEFSGVDLESLEERSAVQDLLALTRAVTHRGDRLAWLALLRAPWCGLSLADLDGLGADRDACLLDVIRQAKRGSIGESAWRGLLRLRAAMDRCLPRLGSIALRDSIEQIWLELGGPATLEDASEFQWVDCFFDFLDTVERGGDCEDNGDLLTQLRAFPVGDMRSDARVEIMTMHKAKGLEFDTVILPSLGNTTGRSDRPIFLWDEIPQADGGDGLIIAPINPSGGKADDVYELLWRDEQRLEAMELDRLLYVAVTRARKRLHLFAPLKRDKDSGDVLKPAAGSLLERVWSVVANQIDAKDVELPTNARDDAWRKTPDWFEVELRRLAAEWLPAEAPSNYAGLPATAEEAAAEELEFEWASPWAKHVGQVTHLWLQRIAEEGIENFDAERIARLRPIFRRMLRGLGIDSANLEASTRRVADALNGALTDDRGRWILSNRHVSAACELALTGEHEHGPDPERLVIDRTFVDQNDVRWIVDYKTSSHEGGRIEDFLDVETERYRPQLDRYRRTFARMEDRPVRTALYFPLLQIFHEVGGDQ